MAEKSPEPALQDIVDAIGRVRAKVEGVTFAQFEADWERRWLVERGAEIISEASRRLPDELKQRYPEIPWKKVAGIGNVPQHDYNEISPRVLWNIAQRDLAPLEIVCKAELVREKSRDTNGS